MKFIGVKDPILEAEVRRIHAEAVKLAIKPEKRYDGRASSLAKNALDGLEFLDRLEIDFSMRLGVAAGKAFVNRMTGEIKIKLHYRLLKDKPQELENTYRHELAHILANMWYGYQCGHGENWKQVARLIGDDAGRCHTMDVNAYRRGSKKYIYQCDCRDWQLTPGKHKNAERVQTHYGYMPYTCPSCRTHLKFTGVGQVVKPT